MLYGQKQCTFLSLRQDRRPCSQIQKRCQGTIIKNVSIQTLLQIFVLYQTEMKTNFRAKYANVYQTQKKKLLESLPQEEREQVACELPSMVIYVLLFSISIIKSFVRLFTNHYVSLLVILSLQLFLQYWYAYSFVRPFI